MPGTVQALKDKAQEDKYINTVCVFLSAYNVYTIFFIYTYIYIYTQAHKVYTILSIYKYDAYTILCVYTMCVHI